VTQNLPPEDDQTPSPSGPWLEQLYLAHKDDLLTAVMCLLGGHRSTAEDVLHDVFVSVAGRGQVIRKNSRNYLITACLNRARDVLRRREAWTISGDHLPEQPCNQSDPAQLLELDEEAGCLLEALAHLPIAQREVVVLHLHGQMTFRELAETFGVSINTVQSRYRYGLAALRKSLANSHD
jgi:RNA polymerase sigma factor (sigma-70 family)